LDAIATLVFVLSILWLLRQQEKERVEADKAACLASDYTIICRGIPPEKFEDPDTLREELKHHFETQLQKHKRHRSSMLSYDIESVIFAEAEDHLQVADINFVVNSHDYFPTAMRRGWAAMRVDKYVNIIRSKLRRGKFHIDECRDIIRGLKVALFFFEHFNTRCYTLAGDPYSQQGHSAYVTFHTERAYNRCVFKYNNLGPIFTPFAQETYLKLGETETLLVDKTPDPDDILWENVTYPWWRRFLRFILTTGITVGILAISYLIIYRAKYMRTEVRID
jgi:hypothetical protein